MDAHWGIFFFFFVFCPVWCFIIVFYWLALWSPQCWIWSWLLCSLMDCNVCCSLSTHSLGVSGSRLCSMIATLPGRICIIIIYVIVGTCTQHLVWERDQFPTDCIDKTPTLHVKTWNVSLYVTYLPQENSTIDKYIIDSRYYGTITS